MIKNKHQIVREWLDTHPGDFTLRQASEATGLNQMAIYRLCDRLGWIERVGSLSVPYQYARSCGTYDVGVYRRATP